MAVHLVQRRVVTAVAPDVRVLVRTAGERVALCDVAMMSLTASARLGVATTMSLTHAVAARARGFRNEPGIPGIGDPAVMVATGAHGVAATVILEVEIATVRAAVPPTETLDAVMVRVVRDVTLVPKVAATTVAMHAQRERAVLVPVRPVRRQHVPASDEPQHASQRPARPHAALRKRVRKAVLAPSGCVMMRQ